MGAWLVWPAAAQDYDPTVCYDHVPGQPLTDACLKMMAAFPEPVVLEIGVDRSTISQYSFWRVRASSLITYDVPNGDVIGQIPDGYNFVNAINTSVDGWLQIEGGAWIPRADAELAAPSQFHGVRILNGLKYPFAWVLDTTGLYTSEYPGGPQSPEKGRLLFRYDRVNIFAEAYDEQGWRWYMVGPDQWIKQVFVAKAQLIERPEGVSGRWVAVDLFEQVLVAYEDDTPVFATLVSTGVPPYDTNQGVFEVWARLARDAMSGATGAPDAYALQSVPYVQYFDESISLHGTYWHDLFGYRTSHGCVNLTISDARFLFDWMGAAPPDEDGNIVNYVYVYQTEAFRNWRGG